MTLSRRSFVGGVVVAATIPLAAKAAAVASEQATPTITNLTELRGIVQYSDGTTATVNVAIDPARAGPDSSTIETWFRTGDEWHHYVEVRTGDEVTHYIDNVHQSNMDPEQLAVIRKQFVDAHPEQNGWLREQLPADWFTNPDIDRHGNLKKGLIMEIDDTGNALSLTRAP